MDSPRREGAAAVGPEAPRVVLITAPEGEVAAGLARDLVERRLAACVNLVAGVRSFYRWEGAVQDDAESLLVAKTVAARLPELESWLAEAHPYDVPECIVLVPGAVEEEYLRWLRREASPDA